jgi:IS605 OrfB family transposase
METTIEASAEAGPLSRSGSESGAQHAGTAGEGSDAPLASAHSQTPSAEASAVVSVVEKVDTFLVTATSPNMRIVMPSDKDEDKALKDVLYRTQRASALIANTIARALQRADGDSLDAFVAEHGHLPRKGADWKIPDGNWYQLGRATAPELYAGGASTIARDVRRKWSQTRWDVFVRHGQKPVFFRDTYPIPLRAQELTVRHVSGSVYSVSSPLESGTGHVLNLRVEAKDALERTILSNICAGTWALGTSRIVRDRKGHWHVQLVYKQIVTRSSAPRYAALNRGIRNFLAAVDDYGEEWTVDGADIEAVLKQLGRRRRQLQAHAKTSGRAGRGRKRILKPLEVLRAKGDRWRDTRIKTIAARFVQWLSDRNVGTLFIEDLSAIRDGELATEGWKAIRNRIHSWPYDRLHQAIAHRCNTAGIAVVTVAAHYISQTCASCGAVAPEHVDLARWQMRCGTCGAKHHLDLNAAMNVLARGLGEQSGTAPAPITKSKSFGGRGRRAQRTSRKVRDKGPKDNGSSPTGDGGRKDE